MKNKDVIIEFVNRRPAHTLNLTSDGKKLFSYQTCIAQWAGNILVINNTRYSVTTSKHQGLLKPFINDFNRIFVDNIRIGKQQLW